MAGCKFIKHTPMNRLSPNWATLSLFACAMLLTSLQGEPVSDALITEFVTNNKDSLSDSEGNSPDWIEIWNASGEPGTMEGYYLTDDPANPVKWRFPAASFNAEGYMVVFASGKDRRDPGSQLHANFRLDSSAGSYLALVRPDGTSIASEFSNYPRQHEDISYGRGFGEPRKVTLVEEGVTARWKVPREPIPDWTTNQFEDAQWDVGATGIGYDNTQKYLPFIGEGGNTSEAMRSVNASIYIRIPFTIDDPGAINELVLRMRW